MSFFKKTAAKLAKGELIFLAVLVSLGIGLAIYSSKADVAQSAAPPQANEITVQKGDLRIAVVADGKADLSTVSLRSEISGTVREIAFKVGDEVKKGDVIARLDAEKYQLEVDMAEASYQAALARLAKAREDYNQKLSTESQKLDQLSLEYTPMQKVPDIFAPQEVALKKTAYEYAVKTYEEAKAGTAGIRTEEANVSQALASLNKARRNLMDTNIIAPFNGKIISLPVEVGETVSSSTANNVTEIAVLSGDEGVDVTASVLELDMVNVSPGQEVEVKFEAMPGKTFNGRVTGIEALPMVDPGGVVTYQATAKLSDPDTHILSGMTAVVSFIIEEKRDVLIIPNQAVKRVDGAQVVEMTGQDGKMAYQRISTGFTDGHNVEVTGGLKAGDKIIIRTEPAEGKETL